MGNGGKPEPMSAHGSVSFRRCALLVHSSNHASTDRRRFRLYRGPENGQGQNPGRIGFNRLVRTRGQGESQSFLLLTYGPTKTAKLGDDSKPSRTARVSSVESFATTEKKSEGLKPRSTAFP